MSRKSLFDSELLTQEESDDDDLETTAPSPFAARKTTASAPTTKPAARSTNDPVCRQESTSTSVLATAARKSVYTFLSDQSFVSKSPSKLFWHSFKPNKKGSVFSPCEIRPFAEAQYLSGIQGKPLDPTKQTIVRFLAHNHKVAAGEYAMVKWGQLRPYHGRSETVDANTATTDEGDDKASWSEEYWERYEKCIAKKLDKKGLLVERFFLQRVLEEARRKEQAAEEQRRGEANAPRVLFDESIMETNASSSAQAAMTNYSDRESLEEDSKKEKLRAGDVIEYTPVIFTAGTGRAKKAVVLSVDRKRASMLVLDTNEYLPPTHHVKLVCRKLRGKLVAYNGRRLAIEDHKLIKSAVDGNDSISAGTKAESDRIGAILDRNMKKMTLLSGGMAKDIFHPSSFDKNGGDEENKQQNGSGHGN